MALPFWPSELPQEPETANFERAFGTVSIRSNIAGPARQTPRHEEAPGRVNLSWLMTDAQMTQFAEWVENEAMCGAAFFSVTLALVDGSYAYSARFSGSPSWDYVTVDLWRVYTQLEIIDPAPISQTVVDTIAALGGQAEFDAIVAAFDTYPGTFAEFFAAWDADWSA